LGLRTLILLLLVGALAGLQTARRNRGVTTIFVLDHSASMSPQLTAQATDYMGRSLSALGPDDRAGLVVFGKDPVIDVNAGSLRALGPIYASPNPSATNIAAAIRLASAAFGSGTAKRLVLLSDGNETDGDAAQAADVAATDDVQIDSMKPQSPSGQRNEVLVSDLVLPNSVTKGEPFEARVVAEATSATSGTIRLDRDGVPVARVPVHLTPGTNSLVIALKAGEPGFYRYRAVLEADRDTDVRNNVGMGFVSVGGKPRILLLQGTPGAGEALARALQASNLDVKRAGVEGLPTRPEDLQGYDSVILSDFPAENMTDRQMAMLAGAVRDTGIGFGMVGGENSFLPGGYYGTPLADVLAVDMNVRQRKIFPSTTVVIVCDTSGSMGMIEDGQEKVKIAASAAASTVQMMSPQDYVGVAGSTDQIEFVAPIQHPVNKAAIAAQIGRLDVGGGGIYIRPSLEFAEKNLDPINTRVRHLILLADGDDSDEQEGALDVARRMVAKGMTISVVAIGTGKDVPFLKALAATGKGSFYLANQAKQLQRLFTRDTSLMTRSAIEEGAFLPKVDPGDEVLRGIDLRTMPPLYAYDLTRDRPLSRVPMRTAKDDPLLAFWQYGLGTSMAFTSDAQPKWARPWMNWSDFNAFWGQTIRSTLRHGSNNHLQVTSHREGSKGVIDVQAYDVAGNPINNLSAKVHVLAPDGHGQEATLSQQGPGRYQAQFDASGAGDDVGTGSYLVSVAESAGNGAARITRAGFSVAYPPEYQAVGPNFNLLSQLAKATGGESLTLPGQAFRPSQRPGESVRDLWPLLLLAAALLFPVDVAVRRLALPLAELWAKALSRLRRRAAPSPAPAAASLARLSQAKQQATPTITASSADPIPPNVARPGTTAKPTDTNGASPPLPTTPLSSAQRLLDAKRNRQDKN
ncbi:MAG: VWA domain-containing protein, partial [Armatimonadota bacterium]|nr:VWA domain-containing protein [Armatimonadota bacterium]